MRQRRRSRTLLLLSFLLAWITAFSGSAGNAGDISDFQADILFFSSLQDRSTGTPGCEKASAYIQTRFEAAGHREIGVHRYALPVMLQEQCRLFIPETARSHPLHAFNGNVITPQAIGPEGLTGPLVYVGRGDLSQMNGKPIDGAILLMHLDSGSAWIQAADLGARAVIYVSDGAGGRFVFEDKIELTPFHFPRFWVTTAEAKSLFGAYEDAPDGIVLPAVTLHNSESWKQVTAENVYCLVPGTDERLSEELVVVEAFYDSTAHVAGLSPGADEACGIATLLELARVLKRTPPARSILLVATSGHSQGLAGMREFIWSVRASPKSLRIEKKAARDMVRDTKKTVASIRRMLESEGDLAAPDDPAEALLVQQAVSEEIKTRVDTISRELMRLRLEGGGSEEAIRRLAEERLKLRQVGWRQGISDMDDAERAVVRSLLPQVLQRQRAVLADAMLRQRIVDSSQDTRSFVNAREVAAVLSLHLSSHGNGFGPFNLGYHYPLKPQINRNAVYHTIDEQMRSDVERLGLTLYQDTLRPERLVSRQGYLPDRPALGGEVSALAGYLGLSLVTVSDVRYRWGTPDDIPGYVDWGFARRQADEVVRLLLSLSEARSLHGEELPQNGFASVRGQAKFIRHGELFPDQPAPGSVILAFQGLTRIHAMVDATGAFSLHGVADKRHVLDKVILEGYRFDPVDGRVLWAVDKEKTGKNAYRIKMDRLNMQTDLVMFGCRQTTLFNLLDPRNFHYMTRIQLLDARREASPLKYWFSRIDTRSSVLTSVFLEPGTRLKVLLSDSIIRKKCILTHADADHPEGVGYRIDDWPTISRTAFRTAEDMWALLEPRIDNLRFHGIVSDQIDRMRVEGKRALAEANGALQARMYDRFLAEATAAWSLAARVYDDVEKTQKDVLFGVLFYIALFVPFAFCLERLVLGLVNIYYRILAFLAILIVLIGVVYWVHPAFRLAYSPVVVILAFFIIGMSAMVTVILFVRFEAEMTRFQKKASSHLSADLSRWKAFAAAFLLGVSNLRRRPIRTALTCITLVILTFTIMSFTTAKSVRLYHRVRVADSAPYLGMMAKVPGWQDLPHTSLAVLEAAFGGGDRIVSPRIWLEGQDRTRGLRIPVASRDRVFEAQAAIGLSEQALPPERLSEVLVGGRWLDAGDRQAVLISERMARELGITPGRPQGSSVVIWGMVFDVKGVFSDSAFERWTDLDGEPWTPVIFPREQPEELSEAEMEALESGEAVQSFQSRYTHLPASLTVIFPYRTLMAAGGKLKAVSVQARASAIDDSVMRDLSDRFGLLLLSGGADGVHLYHAADALNYSGVPNILIPMIISVCIVLNTMISSVYERKREIAVYTSVGLAPTHVGFLFIAEAMAFAVLSGVVGYLIAQTSAGVLSKTSLWAGITVNYSSLAGVAAMMLVMVVVVVSALYPARVASQIAIPDVNRSWSLPPAVGNRLEVDLPFLMKYEEHRSIVGFIASYFDAYRDVSHGMFSTGEMGFSAVCATPASMVHRSHRCIGEQCCTSPCIVLNTHVWLAPFDFGIMQDVEIRFCHAPEDPGYLQIHINMIRKSGEVNAWLRINHAFLHALRKQLLVWRSLGSEDHRRYEQLLESRWLQGTVPG